MNNNTPIPFNRPYLTGKETHYIYDAVHNQKQLSGNGYYTKKCQSFFQEKFGFKHCLLTTSCTDALEMCSLLIEIKPNDEVIIPSYTFVSSANPFVLRGAKIIFGDSAQEHPNITLEEVKRLTTNKTKAVVVVHYAGQGSEIDLIADYCKENGIYLIEDAAQAIDVTYKGKPLGSFGDLSTFSFHETKNIISGEGGLLAVNNESMIKRSEILWEKGTNRTAFFRGQIDKYGWVDVGSSFLPSELIAAFLWAQLENLEKIQNRRIQIWNSYYTGLKDHQKNNDFELPNIPEYSGNNGHLFYVLAKNIEERDSLIKKLNSDKINAVFHYQSLHKSEFYNELHGNRILKNADNFNDRLVRLPIYFELTDKEIERVICSVLSFYTLK